ncbi:hypothetical protein GF336_02045 [Candidatus Woesearchaeota archaeon]|nr:hypothetical protein [Candidatus Woesearchaeota archaeon]
MAEMKKKDFVELEYTGRIKDNDLVFDTTDEKLAKETGLHQEGMEYGPVTVCIGEGQILPGLEEELIGKETGKKYTVEIPPEKAFGKKDAKLIRMIPMSAFRKQQIMPEIGMQVNIDGSIGIIKTASGGRCLVDFNHPLASKELVYDVKVGNIVTDDKKKLESYLKLAFGLKDVKVEMQDKKAKINIKREAPEGLEEQLNKKIKEVIPGIENVELVLEKKEDKEKKSAEVKQEKSEEKPEKK